uniref:Reverse transcriptase domain-containing protein n=2 Tax=Desulfobacterium TaxID=2295 RepID=E1YFP7_9BACT|nr:hypothetical protein N47_J03720 [uncultured Desulfobacterium sp.]
MWSEGVGLSCQYIRQPYREERMIKAKPFEIPKELVWKAFKLVRANGGAAGVDGQSIMAFEINLGNNLYRIWNRMSSGSYFPPPVKAASIPKKSGGERILGVPTVSDRVAQMVVKLMLEPKIEPHFHEDSYVRIYTGSSNMKPFNLIFWGTLLDPEGLKIAMVESLSILHRE